MRKTETWWGILCDQWDGVDKLVIDEDPAVERSRDMTRHGCNARVVEVTVTYDDGEEESDDTGNTNS